jgi:hypothetical protein
MSISLNGSLRTCKVEQGWANRIQSDRFENPTLMVCPVWNGRDLAGRPVCADSFYTKTAGCNSADDRVSVENALRPQYAEYIQLNAMGISAPIYGSTNKHEADELVGTRNLQQLPQVTGQFGVNGPSRANIIGTCPVYAYNQAMAQEAQAARMVQSLQNGVQQNAYRNQSGAY